MKISIITVCYNSEKYIHTAIESVLNQSFKDIEYIVIDGGSTDTTIETIKKYEPLFKGRMKWISEKDNGIYDAMNKGIKMASGDIVGILNSDDYYISNNVLALIMEVMLENHIDSCYGNLLYIRKDKPYRYWRSGPKKSFRSGWMPPHPSFFVKKEIYERYGLFRLDCGVNADYELMLRLLEVYNISTKWLDCVIVCMNVGGKSNKDLQSRIDAVINDRIAWNVNNIKPNVFTLFNKRLRKMPQYVMAIFYRGICKY
jgi:glycosyltransferase involved in cell wall biosynthesis